MMRLNQAPVPQWAVFLLACLLTAPVWLPLTRPGLPESLAGPRPVLRLYALEAGASPDTSAADRWQSEGPAPYAVARLARAAGADGVTAVKISVALALLLLAAGMAAWAGRIADERGSLLAALLLLYAPLLLSITYVMGDVAAPWALAALLWAGWAGERDESWAMLVAAGAILLAWLAQPGLGLWASLSLLLLLLLRRRPRSLLAVAIGSLAGVFLMQPWARQLVAPATARGVAFFQLLEPAWAWDVASIDRTTPVAFALGVPLLGLLILAASLAPKGEERPAWPYALVGAILTLLSLDAVGGHLPFVWQSISPTLLLLLALPFWGLVALRGWQRLGTANSLPLLAALLIVVMLAAGPALSPQFADYPIPQQPQAVFGPQAITLLQAQPAGAPQPGSDWTITLHWVSWQQPDFDYNVFIHVLDANGNKIAQWDGQPQGGARPMTGWLSGEIIEDHIVLALPAQAPPVARVLLGLYNWQSGQRLLAGDQDAIVIWEASP